jgi:hypothetical protein
MSSAKNPAERLEHLRRSSLVELEQLRNATDEQKSIPERSLPGTYVASPLKQTSVVAPQPSSVAHAPMVQPSSSDSVSSLELGPEQSGSRTVSRLEAAAMKEKVIKSSGNVAFDTPGDATSSTSKIQFATPSFGNSSSPSDNNLSDKSPGSFSAETALEESVLSPTER